MKKNGIKLYALGLGLCIASMACKKEEPRAATWSYRYVEKVETNLNDELILKLVNDIRIKGCNCENKETNEIDRMPPVPTLRWNETLARVAKAHSVDMDTKNYLAHINLEGVTFDQRLANGGYIFNYAAENLAKGPKSESEVVHSWLNSYTHCKNMMNPDITEMGTARTNGVSFYWTQLLGTPHKVGPGRIRFRELPDPI